MKIIDDYSKETICNYTPLSNNERKPDVYSIYDLPDYLNTKSSNLKIKIAPLYNGYLVNLYNYETFSDYFRDNFTNKSRPKLLGYIKKLDLCIAPTYKMFYGDILKEEYDYLFNELKNMIERRFLQKNEKNYELPFLNFYHSIMYLMILKKEACLYAVYDNKRPINISIGFTNGKTIFAFNNCYDIDYDIYNLGHINMIKHLQWCFENGFKIFDVGRGDFLHKRRWVNTTYTYTEHILYTHENLSAYLFCNYRSLTLKIRYALVQTLKKFKIHLLYGKLIKYRYNSSKKKTSKENKSSTFSIATISEIPSSKDLIKLNIYASENNFLIKPLNNFLYRNRESKKNIEVFYDQQKTYYFVGTKRSQKIVVQQDSNR